MKNHFARTGLEPGVDSDRIDAALLAIEGDPAHEERREDLEAARSVFAEPGQAIHYQRVHLQYRAMAAALDTLDDPIATDSHRWRERLIEFVPEEDESPH